MAAIRSPGFTSRTWAPRAQESGRGQVGHGVLPRLVRRWFEPLRRANSTYGPAPGFLVGGPNQFYSGTITPPKGEPFMKAYRDWNTAWPDSSWEVTENAIYYQAAYTLLASQTLLGRGFGSGRPELLASAGNVCRNPKCDPQHHHAWCHDPLHHRWFPPESDEWRPVHDAACGQLDRIASGRHRL